MDHEAGGGRVTWLRFYLTSSRGAIEVRLTVKGAHLASWPDNASAADVVRVFYPELPLLHPGETWRFMTPEEVAAHEARRVADEAAAA